MKNKKKLVFLLLIVLIIAIVLVIIYNKTDWLMNNEQRFWKYFCKNDEMTELFCSEDIQMIKNKKNSNPYVVNSNLKISNENSTYTITADTNAQNANDVTTHIDAKHNESDLINFNLVKKGNLIGIKMDGLANGYISVKNNNLTELADKIGVEDSTQFPSNLNWFNYYDLLYLSQNDVKYISDNYSKLISKSLSNHNYSRDDSGIKIKEVTHTSVGYKVTLNESETKQVLKVILTNMSQDSRILNIISAKLKLLNFPSKYTEINYISSWCSEYANKLDSSNSSESPFLEITAYTENGELLQTNFRIAENRVFELTFDKDNNEIVLKQENMSRNENNKISLPEPIGVIFENIQEISVKNQFLDDNNGVTTLCNISFFDKTNVEFSSKLQLKDSVENDTDYDESKKVVLNELDDDGLKYMYNAIEKKLKAIYEEKKALVGGTTN